MLGLLKGKNDVVKASDLTADIAADMALELGDDEAERILRTIDRRKASHQTEMNRFRTACDRYDNLYYPNVTTKGGADHWPEDPVIENGGVHISLNVYPVYVDIPASLQALAPIENIVPAMDTEAARQTAALMERVYFSWKERIDFELIAHKTIVTKALYGRGAVKVYWDEGDEDEPTGYPCVALVDQPRNLWLGHRSSDYTKLEWAVYSYLLSPESVMEEWGFDVGMREVDGRWYPIVMRRDSALEATTRAWLKPIEAGMVEVNDYWYRMPKGRPKQGQKTRMETWNAILVGNIMVKNEAHPEYDGDLPYVPVFNTYLPGIPEGRSELYDVEPLLREKEERLGDIGTMVHKAVSGQFWQLVGEDAPSVVPSGLELKPNKIAAPGAGNRVEKVEPWMPEFQAGHFLDRIDRETAVATGLNELLLGLAPSAVLSSSKAMNALVANYEGRIRIRRDLVFEWRQNVWKLARRVWGNKERVLKEAFVKGGRLQLKPSSITPRDELETASMVTTLFNAKLMSQTTAMDLTGIEDPEAEQQRIREERTDASMFPNDVLQQVTIGGTIMQFKAQQAQLQQQAGAQGVSPDQAGANAALGAGGQQATASLNGPGESVQLPPEAMPGNAIPPGAEGPPGGKAVSQTLVPSEGDAKSRIMLQQPIIAPPGG